MQDNSQSGPLSCQLTTVIKNIYEDYRAEHVTWVLQCRGCLRYEFVDRHKHASKHPHCQPAGLRTEVQQSCSQCQLICCKWNSFFCLLYYTHPSLCTIGMQGSGIQIRMDSEVLTDSRCNFMVAVKFTKEPLIISKAPAHVYNAVKGRDRQPTQACMRAPSWLL